ncbi:MAG: hypothetical protein KC643_28805, partial [Nitrospira sp.]|nr:hypothetical protein [Nitrospira sp.]
VYPFHAKLQYAEDAEWAKWARESGYEVHYVPEAVAVHSHNYTTPQIWKRFYQDARAIGQTAIVPDPKKKFFRGVIFQLVTAVIRDVHFGLQQRSFVAITSSPLVRVSQKCAEYFGYRQGFSERALYERPK